MADNDEVDPAWDDTPDPQWSDKVLAACGGWKPELLRMTLQGDCPRCEHSRSIDSWIPLEAMTAARDVSVEGPAATPKEQFVRCECRQTHKRTPKDEVGCGARGRVVVK